MIEIYHNPRCSKSREVLSYIKEKGLPVKEVLYLTDVPSRAEFQLLLSKLNMRPEELVRKSETIFKEKFKGMAFNDAEWIDILLEYPKLIERPIVIRGNKAVIGRPMKNVMNMLEG